MSINLNQLFVFHYACTHLSFTKAAEEIHITQPAVSKHIERLEAYCGSRLFYRRAGQLELTEEGEILRPYARQITELALSATDAVHNLREEPSGLLRIAATGTWSSLLMTHFIPDFHARFPRIRIKLSHGTADEMAATVRSGESDLAVVARVPGDPQVEAIPFPGIETDELVAVYGPTHRFAGRRRLDWQDLSDEAFVLRGGPGSAIRRVVTAWAEAHCLDLRIVAEAPNSDDVKQLVAAGVGISILPFLGIHRELEAGTLRASSIEDGSLMVDVDLLVPARGQRSFAVRRFLEHLQFVSRYLDEDERWQALRGLLAD